MCLVGLVAGLTSVCKFTYVALGSIFKRHASHPSLGLGSRRYQCMYCYFSRLFFELGVPFCFFLHYVTTHFFHFHEFAGVCQNLVFHTNWQITYLFIHLVNRMPQLRCLEDLKILTCSFSSVWLGGFKWFFFLWFFYVSQVMRNLNGMLGLRQSNWLNILSSHLVPWSRHWSTLIGSSK